jgi:hypothetical protein
VSVSVGVSCIDAGASISTLSDELAGFVESKTPDPVNEEKEPRTFVTMACRAMKPIRL